MPIPNPVRIFHITAIANLQSICQGGALLSKNSGAAAGIAYQNIAYQGAQGARAGRAVPNPPGGMVHDYVPFYFAPRSPMLYTINRGNVSGCPWRQPDIVHFETTVDLATNGGRPFVFYDRNATLAFANPYTDLAQLNVIAWDLITEAPTLDGYCMYWQNRMDQPRYADRMEKRQAELLVRDRVPLGQFTRVGVIDAQRRTQVRNIFNAAGVNLNVDVKPEWYF